MAKKTCQCHLCEHHRKINAIIKRKNVKELISTIKELEEALFNMGADLDYANCILDGSWFSAVEQLERALKKAKNHPNRKLESANT